LNILYSLFESPWPNWFEDTVYQPLVAVNLTAEYNYGIIQYMPGLAVNWTVSASGATYTFDIRPNVTFSNGDPLNAYQVWMQMYGYYYLSSNSSTWLESYPLFNMSNVDFGPATIALINQSGLITPSQQALGIMDNSSWPIYVTSPSQIVFQLIAPFNYFPGTLVAYEGLVYDSQYLLDNGGFGTPTNFNPNFNQSPVPGTGPYMMQSMSEQAYVQFAQNPKYWGDSLTPVEIAQQPMFDPGHAKTVIVKNVPDDLVRYTDVSTGAAQISGIEAQDWNLVEANLNQFSYFIAPPWTALMTAVALNTQIFPTNNTYFRQAIVHAINYSDINSTVFFGQSAPMVGPEYPAWSQYYDLGNLPPYSYNLTLAQQDLNKSGITNPGTLDFSTIASCSFCLAIAQIVQGDLSELGLNVQITATAVGTQQAPYAAYSTELANANQIAPLALLGTGDWAPATLTPADYWVSFVSNGSFLGNYAVYSNPTVQSCVNAFTSTSNTSQIQALCKRAQQQIYNDAPYAWLGVNRLWYVDGSLVWQKNVVKSFYVDQVWGGQDLAPLFNTVSFAS
jgi:peptide/nickel transport system substrate-binding protein